MSNVLKTLTAWGLVVAAAAVWAAAASDVPAKPAPAEKKASVSNTPREADALGSCATVGKLYTCAP